MYICSLAHESPSHLQPFPTPLGYHRQISYINTYVWNVEGWYWCTCLRSSNGDTQTERRVLWARKGRRGGGWDERRVRRRGISIHTKSNQAANGGPALFYTPALRSASVLASFLFSILGCVMEPDAQCSFGLCPAFCLFEGSLAFFF